MTQRRVVVYDIETDGFLDQLTMMSVAWTLDKNTGEEIEWLEPDVKELVNYINSFDIQVGHHIYGFDIPALELLSGLTLETPVFDTLVAARLRHPDITGGHSLRAWGKRLGVLKGTVEDTGDEDDIAQVYGVYTSELSQYCRDDTRVTDALLDRLLKHYNLDELVFNPVKWEDYEL